ncbi:hypothetical protein SNEBB_005859, partial [Seison nebaliae]
KKNRKAKIIFHCYSLFQRMFNNLRKMTLDASGKLPETGFGFFQNMKNILDSTVEDLSSTASRIKDNVMVTTLVKDGNSVDDFQDNESLVSSDMTEVELLRRSNEKLREKLERMIRESEKRKESD